MPHWLAILNAGGTRSIHTRHNSSWDVLPPYLFLPLSSMLVYRYMRTSTLQEFRQEKAKFVYSNPNYVKDAHVFTGRRNRNDSYYTNLTITTLMATGNNVSASITLQMMSGGDFRVSQKLCDIMKEAWIVNFMRAHSDIDSTCPFPPGTYHIFNMVLPPKNMPIPMVASDYYIILEMYLTKTKEQIAKLTSSLRYVETKWKKP
ncbi:jg20156 [Pararge aegeria aegeria]|uniref:Jg20156 protein n=1 Tax=Pararge aegeria aegeria TaxID=348720 RepID=A0A8S4SEX2_9NEOP|nr:jg20156 [Pararge aegeria aegeria]